MKKKLALIVLLISVFGFQAQSIDPLRTKDFEAQKIWVDSILNNMSIDEKIGQLFIADVWSGKGKLQKNKRS